MKQKLLTLGLLFTSLIGYLEWGGGNKQFLFQSEYEIISKLMNNPASVMHPFVVLPLIGQVLLLITLFQSKANKLLLYGGIACVGLLVAFMFIIGLISLNTKILLFSLPFLVMVFWTIRENR